MITIILLYLSSFSLIWAFVGYPLLMAIIALRTKPMEKDYSYKPFCSIILPVYNEEGDIESRITNLLDLEYPADKFEIIIVDSGSTDNTYQIALNIKNSVKSDVSLNIMQEGKRRGKSSAINVGLECANGEIIVITDANTLYDKRVLMEMVPHFKNHDVGAVSGRYAISNPNDIIPGSESFYWELEQISYLGESDIYSISNAMGTISAWRKNLVNFRSRTITEDLDMTIQVTRKGYKVKYEPNAIAYEPSATTIDDQIRQRKRGGIGLIQNILLHRDYLLSPKQNLLFLFIFFSHKLLKILSPFFLLAIPAIYIYIHDEYTILINFIFSVIVFAIFLFSLLLIKPKLTKRSSHGTKNFIFLIHEVFFYTLLNEYIILCAWKDFLFNNYSALWEKAESTRR